VNRAWILATAGDPHLRNGAEAVKLATRACSLTGFKEAVFVGTLAAAYAEAGRFQDALAAAEKARDLAVAAGKTDLVGKNQRLIEVFRSGRAYYETAPMSP
jgi:hypothetical protein